MPSSRLDEEVPGYMHRFFFHSFPRPRIGQGIDIQLQKGRLIAQSLLDNGLLLAPENYEIPILDSGRLIVDHLKVTQRRACFTELEPAALPGHSQTFGPFALVYNISDLRRLGALPVFYVPLITHGGYLSGLATELLVGFADSSRLVSSLVAIRKHLSQSNSVGLTYRGREVKFNPEQSDAIRFFIDVLFDSAAADAGVTDLRLSAAASCFYPTENPKYTEPLHYYRQREWRLVGGLFTFHGQPTSQAATPAQVAQLLRIDEDFFSKRLRFRDPAVSIGADVEDSIANRSHFFKQLGELDVIKLARAVVFPDGLDLDSTLAAAYRARGIRVVTQAELLTVETDPED